MNRILYTLFIITFLCGCKLVDKLPLQGSIYINVRDQSGRSISGATITSEPSIPQISTDNFGSVLVKSLEPGPYEIIAKKEGYGSGKAVAMVKSATIVNVDIMLEYGVYSSFAPTVKILFPTTPANFTADENILFKGNVSDNDTPVESLDIRWESSIDGVLNTDKPDREGVVSFSTEKLSRNNHTIRLIVKDKSGNIGRDSIVVSTLAPKPIVLDVPVRSGGEVTLSWSKSDIPNFKEYRIYRANQNCEESSQGIVGTIADPNVTTFIDKNPPFATKACYFVEVVTTAPLSRKSNQQQVEFPAGQFLDFVADDAVIHPTKPWIYLSQFSFYPQDYKNDRIVVYDYEAGKVITELSLPTLSGFILLGDNGNGLNLYVPCRDNSVLIYDANTFQLKKALLAGAPATDVAISGNGYVFVSVNNQWTNPLSSFNEKSGMVVSTLTSTCIYGGARLRKIPGQNTLMAISTNSSPIDMDLIFYDMNGVIQRCKDDNQHGYYPLDPRIFRVAPKGDYVLTASDGAAYLCDETMKHLGQIPRGGLQFSDFAFNNDGSVYYGATSNRKSIQIGRYPELTRYDEVLTKGYPVKVFVKNNKLIAVSRMDQSTTQASMVEVLDIP